MQQIRLSALIQFIQFRSWRKPLCYLKEYGEFSAYPDFLVSKSWFVRFKKPFATQHKKFNKNALQFIITLAEHILKDSKKYLMSKNTQHILRFCKKYPIDIYIKEWKDSPRIQGIKRSRYVSYVQQYVGGSLWQNFCSYTYIYIL